jgi:hypothetical protein
VGGGGFGKAHAWSDAPMKCCEYLALHVRTSKRGALSKPALIESHESTKKNASDLLRCEDMPLKWFTGHSRWLITVLVANYQTPQIPPTPVVIIHHTNSHDQPQRKARGPAPGPHDPSRSTKPQQAPVRPRRLATR